MRAATGWVVREGNDQPLNGLTVLVVAIGEEDVVQSLGLTETGPEGFFRLEWPRLDKPTDLALLVISPDGRLLLSSRHRGLTGAELQVQLTIPPELL